MNYNDFEKMKADLREWSDKVIKYREHIAEAYRRTELRGLAVKEAHLQELENNLEEAYNLTEWFLEEE